MQPTYLPWAGYFNLMASVDAFVFLDDVQFEPRSWQQRNRIAVNGKDFFLTVPVHAQRDMPISEVQIADEEPWRERHISTIKRAYGKLCDAPIFQCICEALRDRTLIKLSELNQAIIRLFAEHLEICTPLHKATDLKATGKRSTHLYEICKKLGATHYLSPQGSRTYLIEDAVFQNSEIELQFQEFVPSEYRQHRCAAFISSLSIVDVLANMPLEAARAYVRSGGIENGRQQ